MKFDGKKVLVTGGGSGIGLAIARRFHKEGAEVIIAGRNKEKLDSAAKNIGDRAATVVADISVENDAKNMLKKAGRIDFLVNSAAVAKMASLEKTSSDMLDKIIDVNFKGVFWTCKYAVSYINKGGCIINISSLTALKGAPGFAAYAATKAAVINLTKTISLELADKGIRANCIAPGATDTPMLINIGSEIREKIKKSTPLKRIAEPEDIADAAVFLAGNRHVTGIVLPVDGGQSA